MGKLHSIWTQIKLLAGDLLDGVVALTLSYLLLSLTAIFLGFISFTLLKIEFSIPSSQELLVLSALLFITALIWGFCLETKPYQRVISTGLTLLLIIHAVTPFSYAEWILLPAILMAAFCKQKMNKEWLNKLKQQTTTNVFFKITLLTFLILYLSPLSPYKHTCGNLKGLSTAITKETASMISASYSAFRTEKKATTIGTQDLTQYMNFVSVDTINNYGIERPLVEPDEEGKTDLFESGWWPPFMHWVQQSGSKQNKPNPAREGTPLQPCSQRLQCLKLHNGGILQFDDQQTFGGTASTNAIFVNLDPDGYGTEGRVSLYQYFDGGITTGETKRPNTQTSTTTLTSQDKDPKYAPKWE